MTGIHRIDLGTPTLLAFRGPDAERFLNGQVTQDVRLVATGDGRCLPSCVTDAKGRLQFRVWITFRDGAYWIEAGDAPEDELEARLTRYLIADDVEVTSLTGSWRLIHVCGAAGPDTGLALHACARFAMDGTDCWFPADAAPEFPADVPLLAGDELEAFRIRRGVPLRGKELVAGLLPPEAGFDATDISYHKGCYIGQEVISRIKSVGRVNRSLRRIAFDASFPAGDLDLVDAEGAGAGVITSISPVPVAGVRHAMAYVKRGAGDVLFVRGKDGAGGPVRIIAG